MPKSRPDLGPCSLCQRELVYVAANQLARFQKAWADVVWLSKCHPISLLLGSKIFRFSRRACADDRSPVKMFSRSKCLAEALARTHHSIRGRPAIAQHIAAIIADRARCCPSMAGVGLNAGAAVSAAPSFFAQARLTIAGVPLSRNLAGEVLRYMLAERLVTRDMAGRGRAPSVLALGATTIAGRWPLVLGSCSDHCTPHRLRHLRRRIHPRP